MIFVHTTIPFDPDHLAEARSLVAELVDASQAEPGTVRYRAMTDLEADHVVRFFEQYEDGAAWEAHAESAHYRRFVDRLPSLVDGTMESINVVHDGSVAVHEFTAAELPG